MPAFLMCFLITEKEKIVKNLLICTVINGKIHTTGVVNKSRGRDLEVGLAGEARVGQWFA